MPTPAPKMTAAQAQAINKLVFEHPEHLSCEALFAWECTHGWRFALWTRPIEGMPAFTCFALDGRTFDRDRVEPGTVHAGIDAQYIGDGESVVCA